MIKLPKHDCSLILEHNEHKRSYENIDEYIEENKDRFDWKSEESKQRAIITDELWVLQLYRNMPVGFICVAAPTLQELLEFANEVENEQR